MKNNNSTIAAIATPIGTGGISIIRISGSKAFDIAFSLIKVKAKKIEHGRLYFGQIETKNIKDEVMAVYFKAPKSYTGEDVVEIHCHGNVFITNEIINELIKKGSKNAQNGEFTKRAFLNGRISLIEAEGVIDLINAESALGVNNAFQTLKGQIDIKIEDVQKDILEMSAAAGAAIDYPEEDIEEQTIAQINEKILKQIKVLTNMLDEFQQGKLIKEGIKVAIVGEVNVGKSSLLNALIGFERAIVTDIEGTTRDTLEESFNYKGVKFIFIDTAGFRATNDVVEKLGIKRSYEAIQKADIVLNVTQKSVKSDILIPENKRVINVINKIDLLENSDAIKQGKAVKVSALCGEGIEELKEKMFDTVGGQRLCAGGALISNIRHYDAILSANTALIRAQENLNSVTMDCIISDLSEAYRALGSITGKTATEEIINEIFSRFCVGK